MAKILYAPLRQNYHNNKDKLRKKCFFCHPDKDLIVFDGNTAYIIANNYPYTYGHLMVVPKRHVTTIEELNKDEDKDVMLLIKRAVIYLKKAFNPKGFNIGLNLGDNSGKSIDHLHIHIVPRWENDTGFMEKLANTYVISEKPVDMVKKLKKANDLK